MIRVCVVRVECARSSDASVLFKLYLCGIMEHWELNRKGKSAGLLF